MGKTKGDQFSVRDDIQDSLVTLQHLSVGDPIRLSWEWDHLSVPDKVNSKVRVGALKCGDIREVTFR